MTVAATLHTSKNRRLVKMLEQRPSQSRVSRYVYLTAGLGTDAQLAARLTPY
jgi:hypothetical protein